jgi:hypothetical protein
MLNDCEDIISKIKLSFKPAIIDRPDFSKHHREDAYTISGLPEGVMQRLF